LIIEDPGYFLLRVGGTTYESTFTVLIIFTLAGFFALWAGIKFFLLLFQSPVKIQQGLARRREHSAREDLDRGILELAEGRVERGEKLLSRSAKFSRTPILNFLGAARAAQLQGAHERRDNYLRAAHEQNPDAIIAVLLTQAELQMAHGQFEHALATLRRVQELKPGHPYGLRLLARLHEVMGEWNLLEMLLPRLRKISSIKPAEVDRLETLVLCERLRSASSQGTATLQEIYKAAPRKQRSKIQVVREYADALQKVGNSEAAEKVLRDALKSNWNTELVHMYGKLKPGKPDKALSRIEGWLPDRGDDPNLLLAAGRLCASANLWGKAREYLERSIRAQPTRAAFVELGELLKDLGQPEAAMLAFHQGLAIKEKHELTDDDPTISLQGFPALTSKKT
jgi:HemY protein